MNLGELAKALATMGIFFLVVILATYIVVHGEAFIDAVGIR